MGIKMDIKKVLEELSEKEIQLFSEGENDLRYKAPLGAVTPEIKSFLKENKIEIIDFLLRQTKLSFTQNPKERYEKFTLTDIQNSYVMGRNNIYELGGVACHGYLEVVFDEVIDISGMEQAWNKVIQKHDMLRAIVFDVGYQIVQETVPYVQIPVIDLRGNSENREAKKEKLRKELSNKQYPLGKWPMCELAVCIEENRSIIHFSLDMLIADFLSMNIILNDLEMFYRNPEMDIVQPVLYRDVVNYQNQLKTFAGPERQKAETYWNNKIKRMGEAPELPVVKIKNLTGHEFYQKKIFLDSIQWEKFCWIAKKYNITSSMLVLSALTEVVALWSSAKKFCINTTIFNRPQLVKNINQVVGDFTDVNVLSVELDYNVSYIDRIRMMQRDMWEDLEHNAVSGVEVLRKLTKERKKNIIMPVVFTSTIGLAGEEDATVRRTVQYKISQTPQVYIDCQVSDENGGAKINWDIRNGVFEAEMIEDMFETFRNLISSICRETETIFNKKNPLELPERMIEVRRKANEYKKEFEPKMMEEGFIRALEKYPDKTAVITEEGEYTYEMISKYVKTLLDILNEKGVKPGEKIGINIDKNQWQIAAVIATLLSKAIYVPIDVKQPVMRKRKIIDAAGIKVLFSEEEINLSDICENINVRELRMSNNPLGAVQIEKDYERAAYIIFTSGTTGEPKGVIITHRAAMNTIADVNERFHIKEEDIFLGLANLSFDLSVFDVFGCFSAGGTLVLPDSNKVKDPKYLYDLILLRRITILNAVPAQIQMITNYVESVEGIRKSQYIRLIIMSGDWIPVNLPDRLYHLFSNVLAVSMGGATEASIWSICYIIKPKEVFNKSIPYGKPLTNQTFYILDENMRHCPDYVTGNLYIGGMGLSMGYLNDDMLNAEKYKRLPDSGERVYRTGDKGYYRSDGNIIFQGREAGDEQVKIHGHRIELAEIRSALLEYPAINSAAVIAMGNPQEERRIHAVISPRRKESGSNYIDAKDELPMLKQLGNDYEKSVDGELLEIWNRKSELVVISDIYNIFKNYGIFTKVGEEVSFDSIVDTIGIPEKLHKLVKRWLKVLEEEGIIKEKEHRYHLMKNDCNLDSEILWKEFYETEEKFNYSKEFVDYLKKSSDVLPEMIKGNENPLNILFPKGDVKPAMAAYHDNKINKMQNGLAIEEIVYLCKKANEKNPKKVFRILEVGAGVGGTTLDLIPRLDGCNVEYHFTDLSTFFLNKAQKNFEKYNWIHYGIFDINQNFAQQGYDAFSFDVILCANVLHNSQNVHEVMDNLRNLLVDNGNIIILEETRMSYMLLTSMEFKDGLTGFQDERAKEDQTFFTREQWEAIISGHNGEIIFEFPAKDSKLDLSGQTVYIARFSSEYKELDKSEVKDFLTGNIPSYMQPGNITVLPEIPLTENKKVDVNKIKSLLKNSENNSGIGTVEKELPKTDLEIRIADIWCRELKIKNIGKNESFYDVGGDSLLIAQVVGKIVEEIDEAKDWEWSALLTEMMQSPTISGIASKIEKYQKERESFIDSSLIQIKNSTFNNDKSVAKVLFHAGTGTLSAYTELLSYIEKDSKENESILGFSFGNEAEYISIETADTFKVLGKKYGHILQQLGYSDYILIGHCVGGLIALETADYLQGHGLKVSDVTLLSATIRKRKINTTFELLSDEIYKKALRTSLENELLLERTFSKLINVNEEKAGYTISEDTLETCIEHIVKEGDGEVTAEALCNLQGEYQNVAEEFRQLASRPLSERLNKLYAAIDRADSELMEHERKMLNTLFNIFSQNFGCVASHEPKPYSGNVRLFSCEEQSASFYREFFGEDLDTWKPYIKGNFRYDIISGQHFDCITGSNLKKNLNRILDFIYE